VDFNSKVTHRAKAEISLVEQLRLRTGKKSCKTEGWGTRSGVS
jgi:hypothetical protein